MSSPSQGELDDEPGSLSGQLVPGGSGQSPLNRQPDDDPDGDTIRNIEKFPSLPEKFIRPKRQRDGSLPSWAGSPAQPRSSMLATRPSTFGSPTFSLAGSNLPVYTRDAHGSYVDPEYIDYSRSMISEDAPIWSLAKAFPRIVRPGMRPSGASYDEAQAVEGRQKGDVEAIPEVGMIPEQRQQRASVAEPARGMSTARRGPDETPSIRRVRSTDMEDDEEDTLERWESLRGLITTGRRSTKRIRRPLEDEVEIPPAIPEEDEWKDEGKAEKPQDEFINRWSKYRHRFREPLAEVFATWIALTIGLCGSLATTTSSDTAGDFAAGHWCWGLGTMLGIYVAGGISGAHLNPGVSIMLAILRGFPWHKCLIYALCQMLGAIGAGGVSFGLYRDAILHKDGKLIANSTGGAFYTGPKPWVTPTTAFFTEFVASTILGAVILALGDDTNAPPGAGMHAFIIGLVAFVLSSSFSYNTGACLNPVRDFGPRLVAFMAGYGREVFTGNSLWWIWGPWVADIAGIIFGACLYDILVFIGGESPINYPARRRKRARLRFAARWSRRLRRRESRIAYLEEKAAENS